MSKIGKEIITIFADGACSGNPGPGGWGSIVADSDKVRELGGFQASTTNNRMELTAVLRALQFLDSQNASGEISIFTDSKYLIHGITKWISGWKKKNWQTLANEEVKNRDLWIELDDLVIKLKKKFSFQWNHVEGHSGIPGNERVDEIATSFSRQEEPSLYVGSLTDYTIDLKNLKSTASPKPQKFKATQPAYYLSFYNGKIYRDESWTACEARVKGMKGAKYKKIASPEEEAHTLEKWGAKIS